MPRNTKDSDDEVETKSSGRRTRAALNSSVLDSPLRRSTRIKHPVLQDGSSPESVSDVSSVGTTRSNRRRTTTGDTGVTETATRSLRTRRNSVASDISELTETESLPDGPAKRVTRRSIAGAAVVDTPPSLNGRARRATRAGSESKSTPPVGRTTRRNRATSLEPEGVEEQKIREVGTPIKSRRRASVMPSEPALAEESEDSGRGSRHQHVDKTVYEIDEDGSDSGHNTSRSSRRKSKSDINDSPEKMEVDESPVEESKENTIERSARENTEAAADNTDSSEATKPENGSSQSISRSSRSSSYTIDKLLSPSAEKHEKSPGNTENEILNTSANSSRLSGRNSLEAYVKNPEKRRSIKADERRSSINNETPTKLPQDTKLNSSSEKLSRKERYSVDDCVVIIEPMEIDRIPSKTSVPPETPKTTSPEVPELNSEKTKIEESDQKLSVENTEKIAVIEETTDDESGLKISNVVSIASDEEDEGNKDEKQERVEIVEMTEDSAEVEETRVEIDSDVEETRVEIDSQPLVEIPDDEKVSPESCVEPEIVISEETAPNETANVEGGTSESAASNIESGISISGDESPVTSVSIDELPAANSEEKISSASANIEGTSVETADPMVEDPTPISEETIPRSDVDEDDKLLTEASEEKNSDNVADVEESSMETSNAEASNSEEKIGVGVELIEKGSTDSSNTIVEPVDTAFSLNNEKPINSDAIEDSLLFSKGEKSSIVTESPPSAANGEEVPSVKEDAKKEEEEEKKDEKRRKSTSNGRSSDAGETKSREIESRNDKINGDERKASAAPQSDEESECDGYPAFKDIPADEWKPPKDGETNSLHSASTEIVECDSDFELALATENSQPSQEKEEEKVRSEDYDSDDTVKLAPMDVSSNAQEEDIETKVTKSPSMKRASLNASKKINENTPDKNDSSSNSMKPNSAKKRSSLNASARLREEADSDDEPEARETSANEKLLLASGKKSKDRTSVSASSSPTNGDKRSSIEISAKRNRSLNKSADDASADSSDNSTESEVGKRAKAKSLHAELMKQLKGRLSTGNASDGSSSVHESPAVSPKLEKWARKSLNGRTTDAESQENESQDDQSTPKTRANKSRKSASAKNSPINLNNSSGKIEGPFVAITDSPASPTSTEGHDEIFVRYSPQNYVYEPCSPVNRNRPQSPVNQQFSHENRDSPLSPEPEDSRLDKSVKIGSAKKSASRRNSLKSAVSTDPRENSIVSGENRDSPQSPEPEDPRLEKSVKIGSAKKSSSAENQDSPRSPEPEDPRLERSVKIGSAKKSSSGGKSLKLALDSESGDEDEHQDSPQSPEPKDPRTGKSVKIGSAKKPASVGNSYKSPESGSTTDFSGAESASAKKSAMNKNYSTIAQINSDSEVGDDVDDSSDDDSDAVIRHIPKFLYGDSSSDDDSSHSINSDVARDMNLDGKTSLEYSDDDVSADDCMATESERSDDDDDDGTDLMHFIVADDDEDEEDVLVSSSDDDSFTTDSSPVSAKQKQRKRILPQKPSDSDDSDEDKPMIVSPAKSAAKTPIKATTPNKTQEIVEDETKSVDLNVSAKNIVAKNKNLLIQSSTPKTLGRQSLLQEKTNSAKSATSPANKSLKSSKSVCETIETPAKLNSSSKLAKASESSPATQLQTSLPIGLKSPKWIHVPKKLSKSVCETIETPAKLGSSDKFGKTPKSSPATQLQTSLPIDPNESVGRVNLSKAKSTKMSSLNQTVVPTGSESPETRFLMKEKLNDSMPALKVQQRARALRLSILDNLRDKKNPTEELPEDDEEIPKSVAEKRASIGEKKAAEASSNESEAPSEKKKKKKKRKTEESENSNVSLNPEKSEENEEVTVAKKSKKLNEKTKAAQKAAEPEVEDVPKKKKKKKKSETVEQDVSTATEKSPEEAEEEEVTVAKKAKKLNGKAKATQKAAEPEVEDVPKKKKKKLKSETIEQDVSTETEKLEKKSKKKRKEGKTFETAEPEVPVQKKSRRMAAATREDDSDDAPEAVDFTAARDAAIRDFKKMTESIKSGQEAKKHKKKSQENASAPKVKTSVKRLPDDVLANLSAVAERPKKRRKVAKEEKIAHSPIQAKSGNFSVDDGYIPLSSTGGTTQFSVVNLKKAVKHSKKAVAAMTFRERMLARNPRQPVSAYMMYLQKQKVTGMDRKY